jgi:hypothetical protein
MVLPVVVAGKVIKVANMPEVMVAAAAVLLVVDRLDHRRVLRS